jgi:integrase
VARGGNTNNTVNRKLAVISKALSIAGNLGLEVRSFKLPHFKPGPGRTRTMDPNEEVRILNYFERRSEPDMVDLTILSTETGCRSSELLRVEWTSIADDYSWLRVEGGKTAAARRTVKMTRKARDALSRLRARHPDELGPLTWAATRVAKKFELCSHMRDAWDRMRGELKIEDLHIHDLRHTCATRLMRAGVQDRVTMKWMGWEGIAMVKRYQNPDDEDIENALEKLEARPMLRVVGGKE